MKIICDTDINYIHLNLHDSLPQHNKNIRITQEIVTMWKGKPYTEDTTMTLRC